MSKQVQVSTVKKGFTIALIGNPNVGKTVIFNNLTGSRQHVANWPGVTIEKKIGTLKRGQNSIAVIDLPGIYSLTPNAIDDLIARNFIINEKPDLVVDILDASNLERNLYLALLLKELGINVLFVLNFMDVAEKRGMRIDIRKLSGLLNSPVVPTVAIKNEGINELKDAIFKLANKAEESKSKRLKYSSYIENMIDKISSVLSGDKKLKDKYELEWFAIKMLEKDEACITELKNSPVHEAVKSILDEHFRKHDELMLAEARYELIENIIKQVVRKGEKVISLSDLLDKAFLNKYLGIPIFFVIIWAMFQFTFAVADPLMTLIDVGLGALSGWVSSIPMAEWATSFWVDAIIGGFGSVVIFLPNIFLLYFALSLLEDSGYLARAAFVMDRAMYKLGLHGRTFIPMLIGFGCNIPGVLACRAIEKENDRKIAILINPYMSCGARLPVYVLFVSIIWPSAATGIIFLLYVLGIAFAILLALILKKTIFRGKPAPFLLEMSDYRPPTMKNTFLHMWNKGKDFLKKAGMFIFTFVVLFWFLSRFGFVPGEGLTFLAEDQLEYSPLALFGKLLEPVFVPQGYSWQWIVALISGFIAKEIVVGTLGTLYPGEGALDAAVGNLHPAVAFSFLVFTLLYLPCVATLPVMKRELNSWKLLLLSVTISMLVPYGVSMIISLFRFL
ncbi:MAG: ferrous iron transport protein B [Promethearchaeota archaeon]